MKVIPFLFSVLALLSSCAPHNDASSGTGESEDIRCDSVSHDETCITLDCFWVPDDQHAAQGTCINPLECNEVLDDQTCLYNGCSWELNDEGEESCFEPEAEPEPEPIQCHQALRGLCITASGRRCISLSGIPIGHYCECTFENDGTYEGRQC